MCNLKPLKKMNNLLNIDSAYIVCPYLCKKMFNIHWVKEESWYFATENTYENVKKLTQLNHFIDRVRAVRDAVLPGSIIYENCETLEFKFDENFTDIGAALDMCQKMELDMQVDITNTNFQFMYQEVESAREFFPL